MNLSYEQFMLIFYVGIVAAGMFLVLSVVLFFLLRVPKLIGEFSGSTARKAIASIRLQNSQSGEKVYKPSKENAKRGKITEPMTSNTADFSSRHTDKIRPEISTAKLHSFQFEETQALSDAEAEENETQVLDGSNETKILQNIGFNENEISEGTVMVNGAEYYGQTTVLGDETQVIVQAHPSSNNEFNIRTEITLFESREIIF